MSVESYATLLNLKLVVHSAKSNYMAVERDFWMHSFGSLIGSIGLDEAWYLQMYPDVGVAIRKGLLTSAQQHYRESGYFEHRLPYRIPVDEPWYLTQYQDVRAALSKGIYTRAQQHFEEVGFKEGRLPYSGFSLTKRRAVAAGNAS